MSSPLVSPFAPARPLPPTPVSFEEFLDWYDGIRAEWVDGEIILMSPNTIWHQLLVAFLYELVNGFVRTHELGTVVFAPFLMRLVSRPSGREPDILYLANEHSDRLRDTFLDGAADLVVEIVSTESDGRDHGEKFVEYEAAGIPEYWLIDPLRQEAAFYQLGADHRYHAAPVVDGVVQSSVLPGLWLRVAWLWQRPLPSVLPILRELGV